MDGCMHAMSWYCIQTFFQFWSFNSQQWCHTCHTAAQVYCHKKMGSWQILTRMQIGTHPHLSYAQETSATPQHIIGHSLCVCMAGCFGFSRTPAAASLPLRKQLSDTLMEINDQKESNIYWLDDTDQRWNLSEFFQNKKKVTRFLKISSQTNSSATSFSFAVGEKETSKRNPTPVLLIRHEALETAMSPHD